MVSTRQMATIGNANSHNNTVDNVTAALPTPSSSSSIPTTTTSASLVTNARLSFVTKQNSSGNNNNISNNNSNDNSNNDGDGDDDGDDDITEAEYAILCSQTIVPEFNLHLIAQGIHQLIPTPTNLPRLQSPSISRVNKNNIGLLDLPEEILCKIFSYVDYKNIAQMRLVSRKMNDVCMHILNSTFFKLINTTFNRFQAIKGSMPRRESARRKHPLACECDIIETCYMRLSLLQMTFGKHIERGHCCFFPGMILDEVYNILYHIKLGPSVERPFRVTDELFDLSTMAMEYFRDYIEPTLPGIITYFNKDFFARSTSSIRPTLPTKMEDTSDALPTPPQSNMVLRKGIRKIKQGMKMYNNQLSVLRNELRSSKRKGTELTKQISEQKNLLGEQRKQILELANRLDENDKKNEEMSRKFSTLLQELNKCKTELQYGRSKSPAIPNCTSCGQRVNSSVNILSEDYQLVINQVMNKLENGHPIAINKNNSNTSKNLDDVTLNQAEFVFPDESTTAKLLSLNNATKRLNQSNSSDDTVEAELKKIRDENQPSTSSAAAYGQLKDVIASVQLPKSYNNNAYTNECNGNNANNNNNNSSSHYCTETALEYLNSTPPDAKKARRVQKATRYINTSGIKRKNCIN